MLICTFYYYYYYYFAESTNCPVSGRQNTRSVYRYTVVFIRQCSTNFPDWDIHICVCICTLKSPPICNAWWPHSTSFQNDEIWTKKLCCFWFDLTELAATDRYDPSLLLSQFCACLKTILSCRAYQISSKCLCDSLGRKASDSDLIAS